MWRPPSRLHRKVTPPLALHVTNRKFSAAAVSYPGSSSEMLLAASALAYQRAAPSLRRSRRRAAAPAALLDDLGTHLTHFSLLADAGDAVVTPSGIEGFFEAAASKISALQQTVADSEASRSLATALDSGRALRLDNRPGLDKLDRSVLDAFEATVEGGVDGLAKNAIDAAENVETVVLDSIGHDILIFHVLIRCGTHRTSTTNDR